MTKQREGRANKRHFETILVDFTNLQTASVHSADIPAWSL